MERDTSGLRYLFDVRTVRRDARITPANRAFYYRHIHDTGRTGRGVAEFDTTAVTSGRVV
jgi:hypothetical protein